MKKIMFNKVIFSILLLIGFSSFAQKKSATISPKSAFDFQAAQDALATGSATIKGVVKLNEKERNNLRGEIKVALYPVTPYLLEYVELSKKNKKKKIGFSLEFYSCRIETKASTTNGSFEISNLKPGKYYVVTQVNVDKYKSQIVQTGREQTDLYNGMGVKIGGYSTPVLEKLSYTEADSNVLWEFCEITQDNQVLNIEL